MRPCDYALSDYFKYAMEEHGTQINFDAAVKIRVGIHFNGFGPDICTESFEEIPFLHGDIDVESNGTDEDSIGEEMVTVLDIVTAEYTDYNCLGHMLEEVGSDFSIIVHVVYENDEHFAIELETIDINDEDIYSDDDLARRNIESDEFEIEDEYGDDVAEDDTAPYELDCDEVDDDEYN